MNYLKTAACQANPATSGVRRSAHERLACAALLLALLMIAAQFLVTACTAASSRTPAAVGPAATISQPAKTRSGESVGQPARSESLPRPERDPIDGYRFAIDWLLAQAAPFRAGAEWLAIDTSGMVHLNDENRTRFFMSLEKHGLKLIEKTASELTAEGRIKDGVFPDGLLVTICDFPNALPQSSRMVMTVEIRRSASQTFICPLQIGFWDGSWEILDTRPTTIA